MGLLRLFRERLDATYGSSAVGWGRRLTPMNARIAIPKTKSIRQGTGWAV